MLLLYDRAERVAQISLVKGKLRVVSFAGDWPGELMEEMRGDRTDKELFDSLPLRLRGHLWVGEKITA